MNTYGLYTSDGKKFASVSGDIISITSSGDGYAYVKAADRIVAVAPSQGGITIVLEQQGAKDSI